MAGMRNQVTSIIHLSDSQSVTSDQWLLTSRYLLHEDLNVAILAYTAQVLNNVGVFEVLVQE